jgi:NADH-quinone oxidoreductase subunit J
MNAAIIIFFILAVLLVLSSAMVVFLRRVVHCALALVTALLIMAIFFVTLQAPMVGVLQVMVYAGAIMVLFLFVIMFLNPTALEQPRTAWWGLTTILAVLLGGFLTRLLLNHEPSENPIASTELFGSPEVLAKSLFGDFVLPFEIASVLLLVAIIGAVVLAKREHRSNGAA